MNYCMNVRNDNGEYLSYNAKRITNGTICNQHTKLFNNTEGTEEEKN